MNDHLADQLHRAVAGGAWFGPSIFELLKEVDATRAARRPPGPHSIWELTLHVAVWIEVARRRAQGDPARIDGEAESFPPITDTSASAWSAAQQRLRTAVDELERVIGGLTAEELARTAPGQDHSVRFVIDGAIQHAAYHAGQIALLLKTVEPERELLRHTLATLAYRAEKALRDPPSGFAELRIGEHSRTPLQIVGHLGDLLEWAATLAEGTSAWKPGSHGDWDRDVARFFAALSTLDRRLLASTPLGKPAATIFQGPIADALTHVGQIALLRGHAGAPVRPESFAQARIAVGRVGIDQSSERKEFDGDASARL